MNVRYFALWAFFCFSFSTLSAQVGYTANDQVFQYQGQFRGGYNSGFAAGWSDLSIATLAAGDPQQFVVGVGLRSNRDALFFEALETLGYDGKMSEVVHYDSLGLQDLTALVLGGEDGFRPEPPAPYRDTNYYCPTEQSTLFANLYTPIWDGGANGTPYNDENYFAAYMYKTVDQYKDFITFWEIWNEPGFDFSGNRGWRMQGDTVGNWWDDDPDPCDYKLHAPVQHYVRTLRIAWEVIKTLDPNSFVCMGAPGFPSFVDAVARNTDNPVDGSVTADYPNKGGAYFDAVCYHAFPHFDGSFLVSADPYKVLRNSDVGADAVVKLKDTFEGVLENYGYDGTTYPRKQFLITEINLPRKIFDYQPTTYGGEIAQRNFMMKAFLNCKINDIWQMHVYTFGELRTEAEATFEFDLMGLYQNMDNTNYYTAIPTGAGVGIKTMAPLLWDTEYDAQRSAALSNNGAVRIEAFKRADGKYVYALWAKMKQDFNEFGTARYSFPSGLNVPDFLRKYEWKHSITAEKFIVSKEEILVDGTPMFLVEEDLTNEPLPKFEAAALEGCVPYQMTYFNQSQNADSVRWHFQNGTPEFSSEPNPTVGYDVPGFHTVTLTAYNGNGENTNRQDYYMHARDLPVPGFVESLNFGNAFFLNTTFDADSVHWDFGDGAQDTAFFPAHTYAKNGKYEVTLTAVNPCGTSIYKDTVEVLYALEVDIAAIPPTGCLPHTVQFQSLSPLASEWKWFFPGGNPDTSSMENPIVQYDTAGVYAVSLSVANGASGGTITLDSFITILDIVEADFNYSTNGLNANFTNNTTGYTALLWDFGDGITSTDESPSHSYQNQGVYEVSLLAGGPCGTDTTFTQVAVYEVPQASFSQTTTDDCAPFSITFSNTGSNGIGNSFLWHFLGGTPSSSTEQNPTVTYAVPGVYDVFFKIENPAGADSVLMTDAVQVQMATNADFSFDFTYLDAQFTNNSSDATEYLWHFGDGFSSMLENPTYSYVESGEYEVTLISFNDCSTDTITQLLTVFPFPPQAELTTSQSVGCAPLAVEFSSLSIGEIDSLRWYFPSGNPAESSDSSVSVQFNDVGQFEAQLVVFNASGTDTAYYSGIEVLPLPTAEFSYQQNAYELCFDATVSSDYDFVAWDNGLSGETPCVTLDLDTTTIFDVQLIAYNACGNDTITLPVTMVIEQPVAAFEADVLAGCVPLEVEFDASASVADSLIWIFEGGTPDTAHNEIEKVTYSQAGMFPVSLIAINEFGTDTLALTNFIDVRPLPNAAFGFLIEDDTVFFENFSTPDYCSFLWDFGTGQTSTEAEPIQQFPPGMHWVTLTATNDCGEDIYQFEITITSSQYTLADGRVLSLFPNPTKESVWIQYDGENASHRLDVQVFDARGRLVLENTDYHLSEPLRVQHLASGLYSLLLRQEGQETAVLRLVKE